MNEYKNLGDLTDETGKLPDRAKNALRIADLSTPSVITLKVPAGCGEAYRQHPDFGGKFREILEVPRLERCQKTRRN